MMKEEDLLVVLRPEVVETYDPKAPYRIHWEPESYAVTEEEVQRLYIKGSLDGCRVVRLDGTEVTL